jgi:hypothetical protein
VAAGGREGHVFRRGKYMQKHFLKLAKVWRWIAKRQTGGRRKGPMGWIWTGNPAPTENDLQMELTDGRALLQLERTGGCSEKCSH